MQITKKGMSRKTAKMIYYLLDEYYDSSKYRYHVYYDINGDLKATRMLRKLLGTAGDYTPEHVKIY